MLYLKTTACFILAAISFSFPLAGDAREPLRTENAKTIPGISFIEIGTDKKSNHTYVSRVLISKDGRKRSESLISEKGLISLFDNWGIQRLYLNPLKQTASVFESLEPEGAGRNLDAWIANFTTIRSSSDRELGKKIIGSDSRSGFSRTTDETTTEVWFDDNTDRIREVIIDSEDQNIRLMSVEFHDALDTALFSFTPPVGFTIAERHWASVDTNSN